MSKPKILNQGLLKNLISYSIIAFILSIFIVSSNLPSISENVLQEKEVVSILSTKKNEVKQFLHSKTDYYLEYKNNDDIVLIENVNDSVQFENTIKANEMDVFKIKTEVEYKDIISITLACFFGLLITSIFIVFSDFHSLFIRYNTYKLSFKEHFLKNVKNLYIPSFKTNLVNYSNPFKNKLFLLAFVIVFSFNLNHAMNSDNVKPNEYIYSDFIQNINDNQISYVDITIENGINKLKVIDKNEKVDYFTTSELSTLKQLLDHNKIKYNEQNLGSSYDWTAIVITVIVLLIFLLILSGVSRAVSSKNPMFKGKDFDIVKDKPNVTLNDVKGIEDILEEVSEVVELLNNKTSTNSLGGRTPKGILIAGVPGVGKTLLAKAISNETDYNFIYTNGSEFAGQLQGQGADNINKLFELARKNQPAIIFIDEIDGVGQKRGSNPNGADSERTLNKLLVELDGFDTKDDNILVIGATNLPEKLDPALIRDGRFDREITIPLPKYKGRLEMLKYFIGKIKAADGIDLNFLAHHTYGFSGAKLENLVNEAALLAARKNKEFVELEDLEEAQAKLSMGHKLPIEMSEKERWMTAYHEAGHAVVSVNLEVQHKLVHKVSIIPRGGALGVTMYVPEEETYSVSKKELEADICSMYGGRIAEVLMVGDEDVSTGASNDFSEATKLAERMVKHFGLSSQNLLTLGYKDNNQNSSISEDDKEIMENILREQYSVAAEILENNKPMLKEMAKALMFYDTIDKEQVKSIIAGNDITTIDEDGNETEPLTVPEKFDIMLKDHSVSIKEQTETKAEAKEKAKAKPKAKAKDEG
jgi:cell division protease FtsH